ncbi:MAG: YicC family protein [Bacteroidetes bacterium QH_8_67_23]|nr:MAG: YicC family protein [Bacteroidetes bacterium QH_8_67_23]
MIHSMTGFGEGVGTVEGVQATAELRSVNARHLDLKLRFPDALKARESEAQALLKEHFARGRITAHVQLEGADADDALPVRVDDEAAAAYARLLRRLAAAAELDTPVGLEHLLEFSDVLEHREEMDTPAGENAWEAAERALADAVDHLRATRRREGESLRADLQARTDAITERLSRAEARAPERIDERRETLRERLGELFDDERVAADRLEAELAMTADKLDVTEECVRLRAHLEQFQGALGDDEPTGRRLKFLTQELHREANTIGAKANDATLSHHAVAIKEEIEKIREQIRNVE